MADQTGTTVVLSPGTRYKEVAVNKLDYHSASFAFDAKRIFVRTYKDIFRLAE